MLLGAQQTRMHQRKQHASLLSFGWMNVDEDGGSVRFFWVLNRPECTRKNNMQGLVQDGWMNVMTRGVLFIAFGCATDHKEKSIQSFAYLLVLIHRTLDDMPLLVELLSVHSKTTRVSFLLSSNCICS